MIKNDTVQNNIIDIILKIKAVETIKQEKVVSVVEVEEMISSYIGIERETLNKVKYNKKGMSLKVALKFYYFIKQYSLFKELQFTDIFYMINNKVVVKHG